MDVVVRLKALASGAIDKWQSVPVDDLNDAITEIERLRCWLASLEARVRDLHIRSEVARMT